MRKAVLYACLAAFSAYVSAGAVLLAEQKRLIFEPMRSLVVKPNELASSVADVLIPVRQTRAGALMLHAWWMPSTKPDAR